MTASSSMPLSRFKVIDLTRVRAGPTCVRQLADWGADVIKIEAPEGDAGLGGERHGPDFQNLHRNKRSLTLNLKAPEGVEILQRLVEKSDVVVENYRPDVKFRLGVDYESLKKINKRIVYASISGFGQDGPYRDRPGFDQIAQGMGGLMSITGLPGQGPVRVGIPVADLTAGIFAAMGILVALLEREQSGRANGSRVRCSARRSRCSTSRRRAGRSRMRCRSRRATTIRPAFRPACSRPRTAISTSPPPATTFTIVAARHWARRIWRPIPFATGKSRLDNRDILNEVIEAITRGKTSAEWIEKLNAEGVPCGPIYKMNEVFADPQVKHLGIARKVAHKTLGDVEVIGQAIELSRTPWSIRSATPGAGRAHRRGADRTRLWRGGYRGVAPAQNCLT